MPENPLKGYLHTEEQLVGLVRRMPTNAFSVGAVGGGGEDIDAGDNGAVVGARMLLLLLQ